MIEVSTANGQRFPLRVTRKAAERLWRELGWELGVIGKPSRPEDEGESNGEEA